MTHYLTRKRTALLNLQESQPGNIVLDSKIIAKTKDVKDKMSKTKAVKDKMSKTKANAKVTNKGSTVRTRNVSVKKKINVSISSNEEIPEKENQKIVKLRRLSKDVNNKIKSKESVTCNGSNDLNKNKLKSTKRKGIKNVKNENTYDLRQMSLKDCFVNLSKPRILCSRSNANNLKNNVKSMKEHSPKSKESSNKEKLPVYKCVPLESSKETTNEIYEFKFDINDSKEKLPKKRKKVGITKKMVLNKRKKNILKKRNLQETEVHKKVPTNVQSEEVKNVKEVNSQLKEVKEAKKANMQTEKVKVVKEMKSNEGIVEKDSIESTEQKVTTESPIERESKKDLQVDLKRGIDTHKSEESQNTNNEQVKANNTKPTVVLVENVGNKKFTIMNNSNISNSDDFKPFRPTNVFKNEFALQQKNMLNHSLFEKSLSPITKAIENPELSSPWRVPPLLTFPQVKNVFHSTPQNKKYDITNNNFVRSLNKERKSYGSTPNVRNILQKNDENVSGEGHVNTFNFKKINPSISRRFGTEITNINQSLQSNPGESINETAMNDVENIQPATVQSASTINLGVNNTFNSDTNENNENNAPNYQSQAVHTKETKRIKSQSPKKKALNVQMDEQKENLDPQPGPSGLQNRFSSNDQRVLRQSNLNNFLNIKEMPQSTIIRTPHKIFEDTYSSPISTKSVKRLKEPIMELKNAFGFIDEDSDEDVECKSTNDKDKQEKGVQVHLENYNKPVARLSIGEIKNKLLINKLKDDIKKEQNVIIEQKLETKKSPLKEKNKNKIDIATFSDTFDVLSEMGESSIGNASDLPLFTDLEPIHFTQPPRHSYKRKRPEVYNLSEGSESEEEAEEGKIREHKLKRKKGNKMKPEQEKRLIDWIDNINKTFSEVDQHELVIE